MRKWPDGVPTPLKGTTVYGSRPGGAHAPLPSQVADTAPTELLMERSDGPLMVASGPLAQRCSPRDNLTSRYRGDLYR
jgi:hypothetical protein